MTELPPRIRKAKEMEAAMKRIFRKETERMEANRCPFCNKQVDVKLFRTALDLKEYQISGLCQPCIDKVFAEPEE